MFQRQSAGSRIVNSSGARIAHRANLTAGGAPGAGGRWTKPHGRAVHVSQAARLPRVFLCKCALLPRRRR